MTHANVRFERKALTLFILPLLAVGCSQGRPDPDAHVEDPPETHVEGVVELDPELIRNAGIRTAAPELRALPAELLTTGRVDFQQDRLAHVTPRVPGRVERVHADLGDSIRRGEVLVVLDSIELGQSKSAYLQARAHEELARQNFERERRLYSDRISSEKEMLAARASHLEAVARLRSGEETLRLYGVGDAEIAALGYDDGPSSLLPVRAPLAGRVVEKHVTVGELVEPGRNLFVIADLGRVWIWIDVYERDLRNVHLEDDVTVAVDAYPGEEFGGKLSYLSDQVESDTRTVRARIDVDNPQHKLRPGMFARVALSDPHSQDTDRSPSLVVPEGAVQRDGDELIVFALVGERRFERREIAAGVTAGGWTEILAGLALTDTVVVEGAFFLKSEASRDKLGAGHDH